MSDLHCNSVSPLFSEETIKQRVREIGQQISEDYAGVTSDSPLSLIVTLKGAFMFAADLVRSITVPCCIDFIHASSYGSGKTSSGNVSIRHNLNVTGHHLLLVEDIVDTGLTLQQISAELMAMQPASLNICTLLDKPEARKYPVNVAYSGFTVPNAFIVGYGIDFNERYRELPFIGVL
ncbi:MAG: hypoxanthine phosphoribosyltransferase [Chlorobium sp.]|nr:MAG: hypoxanthine phosphoribosyltransferase [Chlorobium sp.]